ncbi:MAG: glycosyltransferase [Bryobacteraceae bacterium]
MRDRVAAKGVSPESIAVLPPWTRDTAVQYDPEGCAEFRSRHNLRHKFVVMYAGNHSPCHPLDTVLEAARRLRGETRIGFVFVGGGAEAAKVKQFAQDQALDNVLCLPYQQENELAAVLSAADLHLVVMGDAFRGIVHPCKIYGILAVGAPCLYIGPAESHVTDLAANAEIRVARHGAADEVAAHILDASARQSRRSQANLAASRSFAQEDLCAGLARLMTTLEGHPEPRCQPPWAAAAAAGASEEGAHTWNRS